ncbi:MAG TPA: SPOR domain-containing protein [Acidocella sp.]|nr:SPOR domain-containing protein [Acidocella sp.]HQU03476.1 SPOR domain-containing protein [Acidocella sp.]
MKIRILIPAAAGLLSACAQPSPVQVNSFASSSSNTLNVADAAIAGGDPSLALSVSQSALKNDPNNIDALIHEGDAYYALGRCPAAEAAYSLALKNDPKSSAAETGMGRCLIKTDPRSAEQALVLAVQDDPGNAAAFNDLGIARDLQGNFAGAVEPYRKALVAEPGNIAAETNLGLSLAMSGNGQDALQYLGPLATSQTATPKIREDYAVALVATGQIAEARHVLSIDLTSDDVDKAIAGFRTIISSVQPPLADDTSPPPPTAASVPTAPVAAAPLSTSAPQPLAPAAAPAASDTKTAGASAADASSPTPTPPASSAGMAVATPDAKPDDSKPADIKTAVAQSVAVPSPPPDAAAATPPPAPTSADSNAVATTVFAASPGTYQVQLGALPSQDQAQSKWDKLSSANPSLFSDKTANIESAVVHGKTYYRLRTGSFTSKSDAAKFCGEVSAIGSVCTLANF